MSDFCNHPPSKILFYKGYSHIDPVTKDIMVVGSMWVCDCGKSFEKDPHPEIPQAGIEENLILRKERIQ